MLDGHHSCGAHAHEGHSHGKGARPEGEGSAPPPHTLQAIIFTCFIGFHSVLEACIRHSYPRYFGLLVHQLIEAVAVGCTLVRAGLSSRGFVACAGIFASLSALAYWLFNLFMVDGGAGGSGTSIVFSILNALSLGAMFHVAFIEGIAAEFSTDIFPLSTCFFTILFGYSFTALLSLAHSHDH